MLKMECWLSLKIPKTMKEAIDAAAIKSASTNAAWVRAAILAAVHAATPRSVGRPKEYRWGGVACTKEEYEKEQAKADAHMIRATSGNKKLATEKKQRYNANEDPIDENGNEIPYDPAGPGSNIE